MHHCWNCKGHIPEGSSTCPHCLSPVSQVAVDQMATIGPSSIPISQIVTGVVVNDRYEVHQELGRGGMGVVYRAHDRVMEQDVAIKVIPQELCLDPNAVNALKRETSIALNLTHSNIVRLYNLDTWGGQAFVVMEYVGAGTLSHLRSRFGGSCSLEVILPYLSQIAAALDYSHSATPAVVHRDLKPLNILLTEEGTVKVADFGLARVMRDSATRISGYDSAGTLAYMAPEQIRGKGIGKGTDIYAFSAIIYEMLAGHPPFHTGDLRWQIMHEEPEPIKDASAHVNEALLVGLHKDRDKRPETAGEFLEILEGKRQAERTSGHAQKKISSSGNQLTGKRIAGTVSILAVLALLLGGWQYFAGTLDSIFRQDPILTVESEPSGATVYVDDARVDTTPTSMTQLPNGAHTVRLELERYQSHEERVFIQQGQPVQLHSRLQPEPFGDLQVNSSPPGASVIVDDKVLGKTPITLRNIEAGVRLVELSGKGYVDWKRRVDVKPMQTVTLMATMVASHGALVARSFPVGAKVYHDGREVGVTPIRLPGLPQGNLILTFALEGYEELQQEVSITAGKEGEVEVVMQELASVGFLTVKAYPSNAVIKVLNISPKYVPGMELPAGEYHLEVSASQYQSERRWVELFAGDDITVNFRLKPNGPQLVGIEGQFRSYSDGTVTDENTGLMWATRDNGNDINHEDAVIYCKNFKGGGYTDWRLPSEEELASLYDPDIINENAATGSCGGGYHITNLITLTCCCPWTSTKEGIGNSRDYYATVFGFRDGEKGIYPKRQAETARALPVRNIN